MICVKLRLYFYLLISCFVWRFSDPIVNYLSGSKFFYSQRM